MTKAIGIDIGKASIYVAQAIPDQPPPAWKTHEIKLTGNWPEELAYYASPPALAVMEPTGWNYSLPIARTLQQAGVEVLYTSNHAAAKIRAAHVSPHKTDPNDARALALIAHFTITGQHLRLTRQYFNDRTTLNTALRAAYNLRSRTTKQRTQTLNRIDAHLHSVWPALSQKKEWWLKHFAESQVPPLTRAELTDALRLMEARRANGHTIRAARELAEAIPSWITPPPEARHTLQILLAELAHHDDTLNELESAIYELITRPPIGAITAAWMTIPRASYMAIASIHVATNCTADQLNPNEFRAACGSHPLKQESGHYTSSRENKTGYRPAKASLHIWTLSLVAHKQNPVAEYYYKLKLQNNKSAIHAARGKLTRILSGIARNKTPYRWNP